MDNKTIIKETLLKLEEMDIEWCNGEKATSHDKKTEYILYNQLGNKTLTFSNLQDLGGLLEQKYTMYTNANEFLQDIERTTEKPQKQQQTDSRWNTKCHCGANAYNSGFSIECERGCYN